MPQPCPSHPVQDGAGAARGASALSPTCSYRQRPRTSPPALSGALSSSCLSSPLKVGSGWEDRGCGFPLCPLSEARSCPAPVVLPGRVCLGAPSLPRQHHVRLELGDHWPRKHRCPFEGGEAASIPLPPATHREQEWGPSEEDREEDKPPEAEKRRSGQVASGH